MQAKSRHIGKARLLLFPPLGYYFLYNNNNQNKTFYKNEIDKCSKKVGHKNSPLLRFYNRHSFCSTSTFTRYYFTLSTFRVKPTKKMFLYYSTPSATSPSSLPYINTPTPFYSLLFFCAVAANMNCCIKLVVSCCSSPRGCNIGEGGGRPSDIVAQYIVSQMRLSKAKGKKKNSIAHFKLAQFHVPAFLFNFHYFLW